MKLALNDDIWKRLNGAYGISQVNDQLAKLSAQWDPVAAQHLYWDELHHQDTLYPVTYAALPWLLDLAPKDGEDFAENQLFLSHVIHCASMELGAERDGGSTRGAFCGLSTDPSDHHKTWIPEDDWLRVEDRAVLSKLKGWFARNCDRLAVTCLDLVGSDLGVSALALQGFSTLNRGVILGSSVELFAQGEDTDDIVTYLGAYSECDNRVVSRLYPMIKDHSPEIAAFILGYPGCSYVPEDPRQLELF